MRSYADRRDEWHRDACMNGLSARQCKRLVSIALFAKTPPKTKDSVFGSLLNNIYHAKRALYNVPELQWAHQYETADNPLGTFTLTVIFAIEAAIINECVRFAQREYHWRIMTLVHDGFNPVGKFTNEGNWEELEEFACVAEQLCPGIRMRFAFKEFDMGIYDKKTGELLRTVEIPPSWVEPAASAAAAGEDEEDTFEGDDEFEPCYALKKREFEEKVFKVSDSYVDLLTDKDGKMNMMPRKVLCD
eukprot:636255-Prymnesium_polylepis.1